MAHWSENSQRLGVETHRVRQWEDFRFLPMQEPAVYLLWLSPRMQIGDSFGRQVEEFCAQTHSDSTLCIFASPKQSADLIPYLEQVVHYQHWVAVKKPLEETLFGLPSQHHALLILTRYRGALRHVKTRIRYSYCPVCLRTTKDYGGKKHVYHEYGTLMSDIWRDIECEPNSDISLLIERLRDLFGMDPYKKLHVVDLRQCVDSTSQLKETSLPLEYPCVDIPVDSQLINGDCLEVLKAMPSNSVDFCFADPPYNLKKRYDHWNDTLELQRYFQWCDEWLRELSRVLKPGRVLAVINIPL